MSLVLKKSRKTVLILALVSVVSGCAILQSTGIDAGRNKACEGVPESQYEACDVLTFALLLASAAVLGVVIAKSGDNDRGGPVAAGLE